MHQDETARGVLPNNVNGLPQGTLILAEIHAGRLMYARLRACRRFLCRAAGSLR